MKRKHFDNKLFCSERTRLKKMCSIPLPTTQTFILSPFAKDFFFNINMFTVCKLDHWEEKPKSKKFTNAEAFSVSFPRKLSIKPLNVLVFANGVVIITGCKSESDLSFVLDDFFAILTRASLNSPDLKIVAFSTMINVFFQQQQPFDRDEFETFLKYVNSLFPHTFEIFSKVDKKNKRTVQLKRTVSNLADTMVNVFSQSPEGKVEKVCTQSLANFLCVSKRISKLSRQKKVCLYFYPNNNVFFSSTNVEVQRDNFSWLNSMVALFRLHADTQTLSVGGKGVEAAGI
jgi:hypothetical protein